MWTIIGVGATLVGIGIGGLALVWRYIAAAERRAEARDAQIEKRAEERDARIEKRAEARSAAIEQRAEARAAELKAEIAALRTELKGDIADVKNELKADNRTIVERMERNHADLRQAIDTLVLNDQAKRLAILEQAVLGTGRSADEREAEH